MTFADLFVIKTELWSAECKEPVRAPLSHSKTFGSLSLTSLPRVPIELSVAVGTMNYFFHGRRTNLI